jgi:hypothetical protein
MSEKEEEEEEEEAEATAAVVCIIFKNQCFNLHSNTKFETLKTLFNLKH